MIDNIIKVITRYGNLFIEGIGVTLELAAIAVFFGAIVGALLALLRMAKLKPLQWIAAIYIELIRGTPILLQLYLFYFMLPNWLPALELSKKACIAIALIVNSSAYVSEIFRSGIQAVDRGQTEAARSLGLNGFQTMIRIVLPQAIKNILPSLCNEFIMITKETSLASTFFIGDLMTQYKTISGALYLVIEPLIIVGVIYFVMTFSLSKLVALYERRLHKGD